MQKTFIAVHMLILYVVPLFLLIIGYAAQQSQACKHTESLLLELKQAHRDLESDAVRIGELTLAAERQRMARELHDTLAQGPAGLILQLEAVKDQM